MSVQQVIEEKLSIILNTKIEVTGCGRTDTGVHARQYFLHFDYELELPEGITGRLNRILPPDIAFKNFSEVPAAAHARYDAVQRSYEYYVGFYKNPFTAETVFHFPFARQLDLEKMQEAAALLLEYDEFFPFCKANSDVKTMKCSLNRAEWVYDPKDEDLVFHIAADRFLRGMVRLIVGMCLNVGLGKLSLELVKAALDNQTRLSKSYSVPPHGLFLTEIRYPFGMG